MPEVEESLKAGKDILANIDKEKYEAREVKIDKDGNWEKSPEEIREEFDIVFIALCGTYGENSMVQSFLEGAGVPYTGSDSQAGALCVNKYLSLKLLQDAGLTVPQTLFLDWKSWQEGEEAMVRKAKLFIDPPYVIKPNRGGNSFDMVVSANSEDVQPTLAKLFGKYRDLIIQPFIDGREVTCGVLDQGVSRSAYSLSPTEIVPKLSHFYNYESKYKVGGVEKITPGDFSDAWLKKIGQTAKEAHVLLGCSGFSRVDMIAAHDKVYVLEVNSMPALFEESILALEAKEKKISYSSFIDRIIQAGLKEHNVSIEDNG